VQVCELCKFASCASLRAVQVCELCKLASEASLCQATSEARGCEFASSVTNYELRITSYELGHFINITRHKSWTRSIRELPRKKVIPIVVTMLATLSCLKLMPMGKWIYLSKRDQSISKILRKPQARYWHDLLLIILCLRLCLEAKSSREYAVYRRPSHRNCKGQHC